MSVTRRQFMLGAGALMVAPALPAVAPLTYKGAPIVWHGNPYVAMNHWWNYLPKPQETILVSADVKALFDQCIRENAGQP